MSIDERLPTPAVREPANRVHSTDDWEARYARRLFVTDALVIIWAVVGAQLLWFGNDPASTSIKLFGVVDYWVVSLFLALGWIASISLSGSRDQRVLGTGAREYQRVFNATFVWFGLCAILAVLFKIDLARGYLITAFPLGLLLLLVGRRMWRSWLVTQRRVRGSYSARVMVVGSAPSVSGVLRELKRSPEAGYRVVGVCIPPGSALDPDVDSPDLVFGTLQDPVGTMRAAGGNTIAIAGGDNLPAETTRRISWQLVAGQEHMVVAPNLIDIAGPRIQSRPVSGLSLIHVETPTYSGGRLFLKNVLDIGGAAVLTVLAAPVLLVCAIAVKATSSGPVLFKQERVGLDGKPFRMLKFRTMVVDAEEQLATLAGLERNEGNLVMFKMANDPRITGAGRWMRRFSLDELPQLFNVLGRSMSLVGPRPPLPREVALYAEDVHRRFLVRPGITGLWQVSGRSNLDWNETVRIDLYYVENWSILGDLQILFQTVRVLVTRDGAF